MFCPYIRLGNGFIILRRGIIRTAQDTAYENPDLRPNLGTDPFFCAYAHETKNGSIPSDDSDEKGRTVFCPYIRLGNGFIILRRGIIPLCPWLYGVSFIRAERCSAPTILFERCPGPTIPFERCSAIRERIQFPCSEAVIWPINTYKQ